MNDKGVYRTAPATPGLLNIQEMLFLLAFWQLYIICRLRKLAELGGGGYVTDRANLFTLLLNNAAVFRTAPSMQGL